MNLYDFQAIGARWLTTQKGWNNTIGGLIGYDVGLGKTATAIAAVNDEPIGCERVLVITRLVLKNQWVGEIIKWEGIIKGQITHELGEDFDGILRVRLYKNGTKYRTYFVTHYEQFTNKHRHKNRLVGSQYDALILDEAHNTKNRKAQRTKNIKRIRARLKIGLSGTLVPEKAHDLWSLLNWLDPKEFSSYWSFVYLYCEVETGFNRGKKYDKVLGLSPEEDQRRSFAEKVAPYLTIKNYDDVGVELPPTPDPFDVWLKMEPSQEKIYKKIEKESVLELSTIDLDTEDLGNGYGRLDLTAFEDNQTLLLAKARFIYEHQAASNIGRYSEKAADAKIEWLKAYLEDGGPPAVIFATYNKTVEAIELILKKYKRDDFFVGTYAKYSEGSNLQHFNHMILVDLPFSLKQYTQALGRIRRMGQTKTTFVHRLMLEDTVDKRVMDLVDGKKTDVETLYEYVKEIKNG
jgi:SNF2 family DNA or RNA helicase